jgi:hypothetical protein
VTLDANAGQEGPARRGFRAGKVESARVFPEPPPRSRPRRDFIDKTISWRRIGGCVTYFIQENPAGR